MSSDSELTNANQIHTDGGAAVAGTVNTTGGDFVGRDQTIHVDQVGRDKITGAGDIHIHHYSSNQPAAASDDLAPTPGDPPYQGMAYYDVADADCFFGREALTAELIDHLRQQPLLAVVGASGSGKSSLVRAGVLPALQGKQPLSDGKQPPLGSARWAYHLITPTARPLESLAASLTRSSESVTATSTLIDDLRRDQRSLRLYARRSVSGAQRLLLLVDQFEELFTLCKDRAERQAFVENLLYAVQPEGVVTLIVTLRADFYHHCADFPTLRTALETQQRYIGAMTPDELRRAIEEPAHAAHWSLQPGLVEQLLHDVGDEPGALPLLSHALLETWQRRRGRTLTLAGYRAAGGVQGAIAKTADDVFNRFTDEQKTIARIIFLRLTELGEGVQDTRRRVRPAELKLTQANPEAVQQVLKTLADARLVTTDEDEVQVAHEALIRHWATLRAWLDDDREGHRIQRRLTEAVNQWVEFGKDPALLYRGMLLQQAQEWRQSTIDLPNQIETAFLQASQAEVEAEVMRAADLAAERERNRQNELENQRQLTIEQSRRTRIFRNAVVVAGLLFLFTAGAASYSYYLNGQLRQTVDETQRLANIALSRQLAAQSTSELSKSHYEPAILLAIESGRTADTLEAFAAIRAAIANPWHSRAVLYEDNHHIDPAVDFWGSMEWSQDNSKILTNISGYAIHIWDAVTGRELATFEDTYWTAWSQNGSKILTSSDDNTAHIWDVITGKELVKFEGVKWAEWNQDGSKILINSDDNSVRIWDAVTGKALVKLEGYTSSINQATWSRDSGKILISSDDNNSVRVWDAVTGKELVKLEGHTGSINQATWSQDDSKILISSDDNTSRIWDAVTGKQLISIEDANRAEWNQDGSKILTSNGDNAARIWDAVTGKQLVIIEGVKWVEWSQDESMLLTSSSNDSDSRLRIWDAVTGKALITIESPTTHVEKATWGQDGNKILIDSGVGTVYIWDVLTKKELVRFEDAHYPLWSQDKSRILTAAPDGTARIWDVAAGKELVTTGSDDNTAHLSNAVTSEQLTEFRGAEAEWNQDGSKILTDAPNYYDPTARIWDAVTGEELVEFEGVWSAKWNQDYSKVLTDNVDGTVSIWYVHMADLLIAACNWTPRNFTWAEWGNYMKDEEAYRPTCPNAPLPLDAVEGIQEKIRQQILSGQVDSAEERLEEINGWLQVNGQFKNYGVDVEAFVAEVVATATAEALPSPIITRTITPTPPAP